MVRLSLLFSALLSAATPILTAGEPPRLSPKGIPGSLICCGSAPIPDVVLEKFTELCGRSPRIVILAVGSTETTTETNVQNSPSVLADRLRRIVARRTQEFTTVVLGPGAANTREKLVSATGIWLHAAAKSSSDSIDAIDAIDATTRGPVKAAFYRGAVIAASAATAASLTHDLFPTAVVIPKPQELAPLWKKNPAAVIYRVPEQTALFVRGRHARAVGDGVVTVHFGPASGRAARHDTLSGPRGIVDIVAAHRTARDRQRGTFPSRNPAPPEVSDGTLILIGGGGLPAGLIQRFVQLAGGDEAAIAVIPIAIPDPLPPRERMVAMFRRAGAKEVHLLRGRTPQEVDHPESLAVLRRATGIWFGGGRQWRFVDAYEATQALKLMHRVLAKGGVIAGSSAGATVQGEYLARGSPLTNRVMMARGYERGLSFLSGVAVDQHFSQRRRFGDMTALVNRYPQYLGIGLDEGTAIVVQGRIAKVIGKHRVCFYDRKKPVEKGKPDFESVPSGGFFDLVERKVLKPARKGRI